MDYRQKQVLLKNGQSAVFRAPNGKDGQAMLDYLKEICAETDFLASFPEEIHFTADDESKYLQDILDSPNRLMIVCTVDGELAGNCQIVFMTSMKTKHRAAVMIGLRKKFWNLGIGSAKLPKPKALRNWSWRCLNTIGVQWRCTEKWALKSWRRTRTPSVSGTVPLKPLFSCGKCCDFS